MKTIPDSYEDAAYIDGAGRFRIYFSIFLPMSKSVIIMTALLTFLNSWNDFINPLIFISKYDRMTIPLLNPFMRECNYIISNSKMQKSKKSDICIFIFA